MRTRPARFILPTLRGRLVASVLLVSVLALLSTDAVAYAMVNSALQHRQDTQMRAAVTALDRVLDRAVSDQFATASAWSGSGGDPLTVVFLSWSGVLGTASSGADGGAENALVHALGGPTLTRLRSRPGLPVALNLGGAPYRVLYHPTERLLTGKLGTSRLSTARLSAFVLAASFQDERETLRHLATDELLLSAAMLVALAGLAGLVVRQGLRPLRGMAETAAAIAAGDTARRVPVDWPRTETGCLALALNHAFDQRQRAEQRLRRFVADASHELRTPVAAINGWADLYFQAEATGTFDVATAMDRIATASARISRLVEELLLLAWLDERRPLETVEVDLAVLVAEVIADARVIDPDRSVTLAVRTGPAGARVPGDPERLRQVVRNLIGNALRHTPAGTAVETRLDRESGPAGELLRLTVADHGPGIVEADRDRVFERFYRAGPGRGTGLGLGLAIVKAIVEAHGGMVSVRAGTTDGACFQVRLQA